MSYTIGMTKELGKDYSLLTIGYAGNSIEKRIPDTSTLGDVLNAIETITNTVLNKGKKNGKAN